MILKKFNQIFISFNKMFFPVFLFTIKKLYPSQKHIIKSYTSQVLGPTPPFFIFQNTVLFFIKNPGFQKLRPFHKNPGFVFKSIFQIRVTPI